MGTSDNRRRVTAYTIAKITNVIPGDPDQPFVAPEPPFHRPKGSALEVREFLGPTPAPKPTEWLSLEPADNPIPGAGSDPTVPK